MARKELLINFSLRESLELKRLLGFYGFCVVSYTVTTEIG